MDQHDLYSLLSLSPNAEFDEVKRAYRRKALVEHPDKSGSSADDSFQKISRAYEILSDPDLRALYDSTGSLECVETFIQQSQDIFQGMEKRTAIAFARVLFLQPPAEVGDSKRDMAFWSEQKLLEAIRNVPNPQWMQWIRSSLVILYIFVISFIV